MKYGQIVTGRFKKDVKGMLSREKNGKKLRLVMELILDGQDLPVKMCDHNLVGKHKDSRECHIEPDWLLIYRYEGKDVVFERTGSHSDLFK